MKKILIIGTALILLAGGCASTQQAREGVLSWSESDIKNVETLRQVSMNLKLTWEWYSGMLDAIQDKISGEAWQKKTALDELYRSGEWDDRAAGEALTLRVLLVYDLTMQGVEDLLPGFIELLRPLF